jgi:hypothetical protein
MGLKYLILEPCWKAASPIGMNISEYLTQIPYTRAMLESGHYRDVELLLKSGIYMRFYQESLFVIKREKSEVG